MFLWRAQKTICLIQGSGEGESSIAEKLISICSLENRTDSRTCWQRAGLLGSNGDGNGANGRGQMAALNHQKEGGHNCFNQHAGWNCCQEVLEHRDPEIWLKEHVLLRERQTDNQQRYCLIQIIKITLEGISTRLSAALEKNHNPLPSFQSGDSPQTQILTTKGEERLQDTTARKQSFHNVTWSYFLE